MERVDSQSGSEQVEEAEAQSSPVPPPYRRRRLLHNEKPVAK